MERINLDFIRKSTSGKVVNIERNKEIMVENISIDSREIRSNSLFVPLKGEHFNGYDFVEESFKKGAVLFLTEREDPKYPAIMVKNNLTALNSLAREYLKKFKLIKIGITGSNGKTTTKDLLFSSLDKNVTVATKGNMNNLIGVPLNIFNVENNTKYLILELGMNQKNELSILSETVSPDIIIITSINQSHIGNFESFDQLIEAKFEIFRGYKNTDPILINGDNPYVLSKIPSNIKYISFGLNNHNDVYPDKFELYNFYSILKIDGTEYKIRIPGMGGIYSLLAIITLKKYFGQTIPVDLNKALENFSISQSRMNIFTHGKITIIDDSYNANPASMENAIEVLSKFNTRKIAVLADMLELGKESENYHIRIGEFLNKKNIDILITLGKFSKIMGEVFKNEKYHFTDKEELTDFLKTIIKDKDTILIKGSHMFRMDTVCKRLKEEIYDL